MDEKKVEEMDISMTEDIGDGKGRADEGVGYGVGGGYGCGVERWGGDGDIFF